ncbi:MAG: RNA methyltransferase [Chloroflexi bacterium]|nr:RNA methyltransferase [Chloroflexota bacterium]
MIKAVILQCPNQACDFRYPAGEDEYSIYCPVCGEKMRIMEYDIDNDYAQFTKNKSLRLECAVDNVRSSYNIGAMLRSANALALDHLYLCGYSPTPQQSKVRKTSLGAETSLDWSHQPNILTLIQQKKTDGYLILAIEATSNASSLIDYRLPGGTSSVMMVVGNELFGVDPAVRAISDAVLQIPIFGEKKSLNVANSFSIAAFYLSQLIQQES